MNRKFVQRVVLLKRPDLTAEQVDNLIDDAARMIGNLVHYRGGAHEDDDVITAVLVIGQDKQERVKP